MASPAIEYACVAALNSGEAAARGFAPIIEVDMGDGGGFYARLANADGGGQASEAEEWFAAGLAARAAGEVPVDKFWHYEGDHNRLSPCDRWPLMQARVDIR